MTPKRPVLNMHND